MRILLLSSAYNSLTQHAHVEFMSRGHSVGVATATSAEGMRRRSTSSGLISSSVPCSPR